jgi:fumarate hydratase class II
MAFRTEKDTMGTVQVPAAAYWGAQTQRSIENFPIAQDINRMPKEIIARLRLPEEGRRPHQPRRGRAAGRKSRR